MCNCISKMSISSSNLMYRYDSNKWSNIRFSKEMTQEESIEAHFKHLIWSSVPNYKSGRHKIMFLNIVTMINCVWHHSLSSSSIVFNVTQVTPIRGVKSSIIICHHYYHHEMKEFGCCWGTCTSL